MINYKFCVYIEKKQRVDMYISALFSQFSRSYIQKMIDSGEVSLNNSEIRKNIKVQKGDIITITPKITSTHLIGENISIEVVYEDENILIVNKDASMNTHPTPGIEGKRGTLVNAILFHCKDKLPTINGEERPGIVHRLDKDTSGAIMIAKNDTMMKYLSDIIKEREVEKYYIAIVSGIIPDKKLKIESYIGRHPTDKTKMTTQNPINPKTAITYVEALGYIGEEYTVVKVQLETGRTHQIRVHLSSIGYPIIGDNVYGDMSVNKVVERKWQLQRQALHAYELIFELYGKRRKFTAELKADMQNIIDVSGVEITQKSV